MHLCRQIQLGGRTDGRADSLSTDKDKTSVPNISPGLVLEMEHCPQMVGCVSHHGTGEGHGETIGEEDESPAACHFLVLEGLLVSSCFGRKAKQIILASQVCLCVSINVFYRHSAVYGVTACH